ncbi:MAG: lysophospholipid transporter LplT [Gammaproteobacteria bacterium]|nr:lysophospholipid transporter LplT [Gammaproteobacteria bacterium]
MSHAPHLAPSDTVGLPLWSRALGAVLVAQFLSALADNALLFGALALLKAERYPEWSQPLLQEFFVAAFIVLAPFVGPFADGLSKGRVMLVANGLKLCGALGMAVGLNPFLAYGMVGVGAAAYSPAKYGILSELTSAENLANSLMESSTIAAILLGAIAGGTLADWNVAATLWITAGCYGLAAAANLLIPRLPAAHPLANVSFGNVLRDFLAATRELFSVDDARFSIIGTSLFWGAGSTMRFLLVAWVPVALGDPSNGTPAYLNAMVAIGIVVGAALAAKFVPLERVDRALPAGVMIGLAVCLLAGTSHKEAAYVIMMLVGACGGFFVVPLNALLQERGHRSVGAGHAIAVQNLAENAAMLIMIGAYTFAMREGAPVGYAAAGFGTFLALAIGALWAHRALVTRRHA